MKIQHASIPGVVTGKLVDTLISQMETTPMPRIRAAALRQLYSVGITIDQISKATLRDLEAGDAILNQKPHEEQSAAPETQVWLEWLAMYQLAQDQLRHIETAIAASDVGAA